MESKVGIKETLELLEGLKIVAVPAVKLTKDFTLAKLVPELVAVAMKTNELKSAIEGVKLIGIEAKDLDAQEAGVIVAKVFEIVAALKATQPEVTTM